MKLASLFILLIAHSAQALVLEAGETTRINGTTVTCMGQQQNRCTISKSNCNFSDEVRVFIDGNASSGCVETNKALAIIDQFNQRGLYR